MMFPEESFAVVKVRGQALHPILWHGEQWAVTEYGIECLDGRYQIEAKSFFTTHAQWAKSSGTSIESRHIKHMGEKGWVDIDDFEDAMTAFRLLFNQQGKRTAVQPPRFRDPAEVEAYAVECAERAYQEARARASRGTGEIP